MLDWVGQYDYTEVRMGRGEVWVSQGGLMSHVDLRNDNIAVLGPYFAICCMSN